MSVEPSRFALQALVDLEEQMPKNSVAFAAHLNGDQVPDVVVAMFHEVPTDEDLEQGASFTGFVSFSYAMGSESSAGGTGLGPLQSAADAVGPDDELPVYFGYNNKVSTRVDLNGDGLREVVSLEFTPSATYHVRSSLHSGRFEDYVSGHNTEFSDANLKHERAKVDIKAIFDGGVPGHPLVSGTDFNRDGLADRTIRPEGTLSPGLVNFDDYTGVEDLRQLMTHGLTPLLVK